MSIRLFCPLSSIAALSICVLTIRLPVHWSDHINAPLSLRVLIWDHLHILDSKRLILYKQLTALFARYIAAHLHACGTPHGIHAPDGSMIGAIDILSLADGQIRLAGWTLADDVVLHMNGVKAATKPGLRRDDVAKIYGHDPLTGFDLIHPLGPVGLAEITRFGVEFHRNGLPEAPVAISLNLNRVRFVQMMLIVRFCLAVCAQLPALCGWLTTRNPNYRTRIKQGLQLTALPPARELDPDLFRKTAKRILPAGSVTIVMPVYNAFDLLQQCLTRIENHTDLKWRLILVEDCSTDPCVRPYLREWQMQRRDQVILLENKDNLGFIQSVNRGFEKAVLWGDPVVLLNTDALVPADWASRLLAPMFTHKDVATVTPMSNDAEIFTVPVICAPTGLAATQGDKIDKVAATLNPYCEIAQAPTGVGFCMAINMRYLSKVPVLDISFGKGYGEEVDWCQRVRAMGGKHLCANTLFVEHRGGQSFGTAEKRRLIAQNNLIITKRYPQYDMDVQRFVQSDPLRSTRLALALAWIGAQDGYPVSIYLAHSMGGGAEAYLQDRIRRKHHAKGRSAVILRVGGRKRWQLELLTPNGVISGQTDDLDYIEKLLDPLTRRRIIYSCGVGDHDPTSLPDVILRLCNKGQQTLEILFHDYFPISPNYTLLDANGWFSGVPMSLDDGTIETDAESQQISRSQWQNRWNEVMRQSKEIIVFSANSAGIVSEVFPDVAHKLAIRPHHMLRRVNPLPAPKPSARPVVGILGDIGLQKGARLIAPLGIALEQQNIGCVIVGNFDPAFPRPASVPAHGTYKVEDIAKIVARYGITDWLIPSIWPETFSFTTHEALATGLPVHAFALGAQGDAVEKAANGRLVPFAPGRDLAPLLIDHFAQYFSLSRRAA